MNRKSIRLLAEQSSILLAQMHLLQEHIIEILEKEGDAEIAAIYHKDVREIMKRMRERAA